MRFDQFNATDFCDVCETPFSESPCCCDNGNNGAGLHLDGVCIKCCGPHEERVGEITNNDL